MLIYLYNELLDPYIFWFLFLLLPLMVSYGSAKEDEALHKKFPEIYTRKITGTFLSNFVWMIFIIYFLILIIESIVFTTGYLNNLGLFTSLEAIGKKAFIFIPLSIFVFIIICLLNWLFWMGFVFKILDKIFFKRIVRNKKAIKFFHRKKK